MQNAWVLNQEISIRKSWLILNFIIPAMGLSSAMSPLLLDHAGPIETLVTNDWH